MTMKGIVFAEFIEMVEQRYSLAVVDRIIRESNLATGGAYTAVGTYDHQEMVEMVGHLSEVTGVSVADLLRTFGENLLKRFTEAYPAYFAECSSAFEFLATLDNKIHVEVRKLYPDAELPRFDHEFPTSDRMILEYRSRRSFADLAEGLLRGCIGYFGERIELTRTDMPCKDGAHTRFELARQADAQ